MTDPITPADLHAFVDDQLDIARRIEVEDHLSRHPDAAARVMADMRTRDALGLAFGARSANPPSMPVMDAARRLERGLAWRRISAHVQRAGRARSHDRAATCALTRARTRTSAWPVRAPRETRGLPGIAWVARGVGVRGSRRRREGRGAVAW